MAGRLGASARTRIAIATTEELATTTTTHTMVWREFVDRLAEKQHAQVEGIERTRRSDEPPARVPHGYLAAAAESFLATLKVEFYDRHLWPTKAAAKLAVGDWIERVYNRRRRHSAIGMISPVEY